MPKFRVMASIELEAESQTVATETISDFLEDEKDVDWTTEVLSTETVTDKED